MPWTKARTLLVIAFGAILLLAAALPASATANQDGGYEIILIDSKYDPATDVSV